MVILQQLVLSLQLFQQVTILLIMLELLLVIQQYLNHSHHALQVLLLELIKTVHALMEAVENQLVQFLLSLRVLLHQALIAAMTKILVLVVIFLHTTMHFLPLIILIIPSSNLQVGIGILEVAGNGFHY